MPSVKWAKPHEWKSGDHRGLARLERDLREQRRRRVEVVRLLARRALRCAGGARGEDHHAPRLGGRVVVGGVAVADQLVDHRVGVLGGVVGPGDEALAPLGSLGDELGELLVVDERDRVLALDDVGDLGRREHRVEVQRMGAELRERHRGLDEPAVVAAHDRHAVALLHPRVRERRRERVRAPVDLLEGQRAELVDDGHVVRIPRRRRGVARGGSRAEADERLDHTGEAVRSRGADDPGTHQGPGHPELVGDLVCDAHSLDPATLTP
jgi:hypothetical protein